MSIRVGLRKDMQEREDTVHRWEHIKRGCEREVAREIVMFSMTLGLWGYLWAEIPRLSHKRKL